jgi:hypothetical protein
MAQLTSNSNVTFKLPSHKQPQIQIQEGKLPFHDMSMFLSTSIIALKENKSDSLKWRSLVTSNKLKTLVESLTIIWEVMN